MYSYMRLCPALRKAKITNPENQAGKDFCTQSCPYSECIAVEGDTLTKYRIGGEKSWARRLHRKGLTVGEIAVRMSKSVRTVKKYLE